MISDDFYSAAGGLAGEGRPFAVATVVRVEGSSSARQGSKALIDERGRMVQGWVGGGCAESAILAEALECIKSGVPRLITLDMQDEVLGVGMPCGGRMEVYIEPVLPKPEMVIAGHGRIAETLAALGHLMNFSVTVHDPSAEREKFPDAEKIISKDFGLSEVSFGPHTYVVIATLHKNDHLWLQRALGGQTAYVALVASAHRSRLVLNYLLAEGMPAEKLKSVWAPAGLDLGSANPEEIALSIMSQIVALRRRANPGSLKQKADLAGQDDRAPSSETETFIRKCETGSGV